MHRSRGIGSSSDDPSQVEIDVDAIERPEEDQWHGRRNHRQPEV